MLGDVYDADGTVDPARFDAYLAAEGVDVALRAGRVQPEGDRDPAGRGPAAADRRHSGRVRLVANVNPHLHYPVEEELARQLDLGAVALKIHPVHGGFPANDRSLYPAYAICQDAGIPLVVHCGTQHVPRLGEPLRRPDPARRRAARLPLASTWCSRTAGGAGGTTRPPSCALVHDRVWIELSGLPPSRLRDYYARHSWPRLTRRMIFGTDWPGVPGIARNARAVAALCPDETTAGLVLAGNAAAVYHLKLPA